VGYGTKQRMWCSRFELLMQLTTGRLATLLAAARMRFLLGSDHDFEVDRSWHAR
jgi:hypothetical protein